MVKVKATTLDYIAEPLRHRPSRWTGETRQCKHCDATFYARRCESTKMFCSHMCASDNKRKYPRQQRQCKTCGASFLYSDKPYSNNSGVYCSLDCRNTGYMERHKESGVVGARGHRAGWRSIRNRFVRDGNDFCTRCGRDSGRLMVHHVEPYRVQRRNDTGNLMTLCPKCHSAMEPISDLIETFPEAKRRAAVLVVQGWYGDRWCELSGQRGETCCA